MIGRVISGRYVVQAIVGTGGMAVVYRAFDKKKNRIVAIKVLRAEYESDEEFVRRFSREAEAASKVSHENIVNMLDVGIDGDMRYIVMEFVDGKTLKDLIRDKGAIPPDTAIRMTIRILAAVDHAHRNGIVHRDIKPQNILVNTQGRVKVADFGIARLKTTHTGAIEEGQGQQALGSVHYFSPEQARGEMADEKSDIYSVGVVLYEMLTGAVPFEGDNSVSIALKHLNETPQSMRERQPDVSKALDEVVMRALCKDPARRYQSAAEMAGDLRKCITNPQGGFVKYPRSPEEIEREREARRNRRMRDRLRLRRTAIISIALAVALVIAAGVWFVQRYIDTYAMPDLVGQDRMLAEDILDHLSEKVTMAYEYSEDFEEGVVMSQTFAPGTRVKVYVPVTLTVSRGSQWYYLEDCVGKRASEVVERLEAQGVSVNVTTVASESPVDTVVSVTPGSGTQSKLTPVQLTVSGRRVIMPSLTGLSLENAQALMAAQGLLLGQVSEGYAADAKAGTVVAQSIAANSQVLAGTTVDLTLNQQRTPVYYPESKLSVVVPLNQSQVKVQLQLNSGETQEIYSGTLDMGTYRVALQSPEPGPHPVTVTVDGVVMETIEVEFY